ncbi:MAG: hypothetical protein WDN69_12040 [Aliidongia sp.]
MSELSVSEHIYHDASGEKKADDPADALRPDHPEDLLFERVDRTGCKIDVRHYKAPKFVPDENAYRGKNSYKYEGGYVPKEP